MLVVELLDIFFCQCVFPKIRVPSDFTQGSCNPGIPNQHSEGGHWVRDRGREDVQHTEAPGELQEVTELVTVL